METSNRVLDTLLEGLSLPHVEERIPRDVFDRLGLKFPQQYAIAARDVRTCVKRAESLGAGPFLVATIPAPNWVERGTRIKHCQLELALGYAGDRQVEFLGPGRGTQHYSAALKDTDVAFHHVGIYQDGMATIAPTLTSNGYPEVVRGGLRIGSLVSVDFRYFDARHDYGVYFEIQELRSFGREFSLNPLIRAYAELRRRLPL